MNQCYKLPDKITNKKWYERLSKSIENKLEEDKVSCSLTTIVPKKLARCIFVEKGIIA